MLVIQIDRLNEDGSKTKIDLNCSHIVFTANHLKKEFADSTVIALSNGVVMHVDIERHALAKIMKDYTNI